MDTQTNWSTDNCICGYWKDGKYTGKKSHGENCPNHLYDNTPNAKVLMEALRTIMTPRTKIKN